MKLSAIALIFALFPALAIASDVTKWNLAGTNKVQTYHITPDSSRTLVLHGPVVDSNMGAFVERLEDFVADSKEDVYVVIDSPGGSIDAGMRFIRAMVSAKATHGVKTICLVENEAYSMAALIAIFCHQTYMMPLAGFLFHEASYGVQGSTTQVRNRVAFLTRVLGILDKEIATQLGVALPFYLAKSRAEWWVNAEEAVRFGLADGLLAPFYYTAKPPKTRPFEVIFGRQSNQLWLEWLDKKISE